MLDPNILDRPSTMLFLVPHELVSVGGGGGPDAIFARTLSQVYEPHEYQILAMAEEPALYAEATARAMRTLKKTGARELAVADKARCLISLRCPTEDRTIYRHVRVARVQLGN